MKNYILKTLAIALAISLPSSVFSDQNRMNAATNQSENPNTTSTTTTTPTFYIPLEQHIIGGVLSAVAIIAVIALAWRIFITRKIPFLSDFLSDKPQIPQDLQQTVDHVDIASIPSEMESTYIELLEQLSPAWEMVMKRLELDKRLISNEKITPRDAKFMLVDKETAQKMLQDARSQNAEATILAIANRIIEKNNYQHKDQLLDLVREDFINPLKTIHAELIQTIRKDIKDLILKSDDNKKIFLEELAQELKGKNSADIKASLDKLKDLNLQVTHDQTAGTLSIDDIKADIPGEHLIGTNLSHAGTGEEDLLKTFEHYSFER